MRSKGFTLIELMAVIIILSVIVIITTPVVINVVSKASSELSKEQAQIIENGARMWGVKNLSVDEENRPVKDSAVIYFVKLNDLITDGYIENKEFKNLNLEELGNAGVCISYNNQFIYEFTDDVDKC